MQLTETARPNPPPASRREVVAGLYNAGKCFDSFWEGNFTRALANVTFEVRRGEVFGLLGPPGAGKTTALKMLAGKLRRTEGKVRVFGRSPRRASVRARIGWLPERASRARQEPAPGLLRLLGRLFVLISGEPLRDCQPVAGLMHALLGKPDLLLLDEPLDGLDQTVSGEMKQRMLALARGGKTLVVTSRWLADLSGLCDRMALFREGTVEAVGSTEELLSVGDALCRLAPVLSPALSHRLVCAIREDLHAGQIAVEPSREPLGKGLSSPGRDVSPEEACAARVGPGDNVLAALVQAPVADPPASISRRPADRIDHGRLAELTRPAGAKPPPSPRQTGGPPSDISAAKEANRPGACNPI